MFILFNDASVMQPSVLLDAISSASPGTAERSLKLWRHSSKAKAASYLGDHNVGGLASLRSRRYSRAQREKLEIPPAQKLSILSSAHRAHGSAHTNVFALENQSERELLIMLLAGLQCSKRCQFNNCLILFCIFLSWRAKQLPRKSKHTR